MYVCMYVYFSFNSILFTKCESLKIYSRPSGRSLTAGRVEVNTELEPSIHIELYRVVRVAQCTLLPRF